MLLLDVPAQKYYFYIHAPYRNRMKDTLKKVANAIFAANGQAITNISEDMECEAYCGYNAQIGKLNIKFRQAKITPKKIGQFVTLWKRNSLGQTEPFHASDNFDFYIIATETASRFGVFLFPGSVLCDKHILTAKVEGKRGFRVYADWDMPENSQATRTKEWQTAFFIDLTNVDGNAMAKLRLHLNQYQEKE